MASIQADQIHVGLNSYVHPTASIRGINGTSKRISIGDNCYIGENVQIICDDFSIGDYSKIHHHTNIHGYEPCSIGHNAWIGQYTIIDCIGGVTIGNNCGIGAHSQLWSHIKYGDTLAGCRFLQKKPMLIGDDVWFVGHCIVSPITAENKSMAMVGSVVTKDMHYNEIYAGSPAKSITDKVGPPFEDTSVEFKLQKMKSHLTAFGSPEDLQIVQHEYEVQEPDRITYFNIRNRTYNKRLSDSEIGFMKFLLPEKGKFVPITYK